MARDPVLTFTLPGTFDLTAAVLWGYHFGQLHNNEAKAFTTEFSSDGGTTWHTPVQFDHGRSAAASETHAFGQTVRADTVRFTITDNHFGAAGIGGGDRVGIGEVRFLGAEVLDPAPVAFAPAAYDFGTFAADPGPLDATIPLANTGPDLPLNVLGTSLSGPGAPKFTVISAPGGVIGTFASEDFSGASLDPGLGWDLLYNPTNVQLQVVANPDLDSDNDVDGWDFLEIQRANSDLIPEWESQFGAASPAAAASFASLASVPEPTSLMLLAMALPLLARRSRVVKIA